MTHSFDFIYSGRFIHSPRIAHFFFSKLNFGKKLKWSETSRGGNKIINQFPYILRLIAEFGP